MKIWNKYLIGMIVSVLCLGNAGAVQQHPCPTGCFCLNNGLYEPRGDSGATYYEDACVFNAASITSMTPGSALTYCDATDWFTVILGNGTNWTDSTAPNTTYYFDEFSELYNGSLGAYGFINNNFVHISGCASTLSSGIFRKDNIFQCPETHPYSQLGSDSLNDCYKFTASGVKVYYGTTDDSEPVIVNCLEGYYLPANSTHCVPCQPSFNQVCPGGSFAASNQIQGLKVWCNPRQYLPANATQCVPCEDSYYFCNGGVYDFNATEAQGRIKHNGYINILKQSDTDPNALHKFSTCKPGYYKPANSNLCVKCKGNYVCPGGMFYDDAQYGARGLVFCAYGVPNAAHTECVGQTSQPSVMKKKVTTANNIEEATPTPSKKMNTVSKNVVVSIDRALTQRPESVKVTEPEPIENKPVVGRSVKTVPQINSVHGEEHVRERPEIKRPSRSQERSQR